MNLNSELKPIEHHLDNAMKALEILSGDAADERKASLLEVISIQFELAVIKLRQLTDTAKPMCQTEVDLPTIQHKKEPYGEIELTEQGWLHIKLHTLLPSNKSIKNSAYITDSLTRLIDNYKVYGDELPFFEKAFVAIVEDCNQHHIASYDHDNKAYSAVINTLKGRLFSDDNQFQMSLAMFTRVCDEVACHVYVIPETDAPELIDTLVSSWI